MKKRYFGFIALIIVIGAIFIFLKQRDSGGLGKEPNMVPNAWYLNQRLYPKEGKELDISVVKHILEQSKLIKYNKTSKNTWELMGPSNISGRVTDIEGVPGNADTAYIGSASGGIFKTVDGGYTWTQIFDENGILPIGDIAIHPDSHNIILAGTGESNATSQSYPGNGLYISRDGGISWQHAGLDSSYYIGRIVYNPLDPSIIYVAATGKLFGKNQERGVYRSVNGGQNWERVLYVSDSTSAIDIVIDPQHPDTLYAAMWERIRYINYRQSGGPTSGVYKSEDGGDNWIELSGGLPADIDNPGRIGLAIAPTSTNRIYALYANESAGIDSLYVSDDCGQTWVSRSIPDIYRWFGWYFGNVRVSPVDENTVWILGVYCYRSDNSGDNWSEVFGFAHVDFHAMYFTGDSNQCIVGTDGGANLSYDGTTVSASANLPNMQFYQGSVDPHNDNRIYGGSQDNGTNRSIDGSVDNWEHIFGGDGFYCAVAPDDSEIVYAESQYGGLARSTNFCGSWTYIDGDFSSDRTGWSTPYVISLHNPLVLYLGTYRLYKSTDRGSNWTIKSNDLTYNTSGYESVISVIAISPVDSNTVYVGTSDGRLWRSDDGGDSLVEITGSIPNRWITGIAAHPTSPDSVVVCFSGFRWDENAPHMMISGNKGGVWVDISGNLPDLPVNDVIYSKTGDSIFIANDAGVMYTVNQNDYYGVGTGLPPVPVTDIDIDPDGQYLYAFTYGRSAYRLDLSQSSGISSEMILSGFIENNTVCLEWSPFPGAYYKIYRSQADQYQLLGNTNVPSFRDINPKTGSNHYRVVSLLSNGDSLDNSITVYYSRLGKLDNIAKVYSSMEEAEKLFKLDSLHIHDALGREIRQFKKPGRYFIILNEGNKTERKDILILK